MTTVNISLPDSMRDFINEQLEKGGYSTTSEYIRHLIRQDLEKVQKSRIEKCPTQTIPFHTQGLIRTYR